MSVILIFVSLCHKSCLCTLFSFPSADLCSSFCSVVAFFITLGLFQFPKFPTQLRLLHLFPFSPMCFFFGFNRPFISKFHVPFCLIFLHTFLFLRHSVAPWCTSFRSASTMASLDLWALRAMYSSGNHIFEILSFKHRNYVLSSFGVGNSAFYG